MMTAIPLTRDEWALVDPENWEFLSQFKWQFDGRYAKTSYTPIWGGGQKMIRMHVLIMMPPKGMFVDHINRDQLDNRKVNLRVCTHSENLGNSGKRKNSSNPYKGITPWGKKWRARIGDKHLGLFATPEEASEAYQRAAKERYNLPY